MVNKEKKGMSIHWMKKSLKSNLEEGTHVSPDVYEKMTQVVDKYVDNLIKYTVKSFENDSSRSRVHQNHVFEALYYLSGVEEE